MVKNNEYIIPKENLAKVEEIKMIESDFNKSPQVREIENEIPSCEEINLNYADLENSDISIDKGYGPCSYSSCVVNPHKIAGKHINMCGSLDCSYYRRITGNRVGGFLGTTASIATGVAFWGALAATPFTGGASLAVATGLSTAASASAVGGTALTINGATETLEGIENELKLKWENERIKESINKLQNELKEIKTQYKRGEINNYKLKQIIKEKEKELRELEKGNRNISQESELRRKKLES
ncbi:hypothetical protein [endosymbiont GvMRE of Glomus versiforme]|uniref:hypothetical protein n=1 Tax=endosymbiont GvMRE of Glomus versiforme TaxID=2039283 RepID=UPI000EDA5BBD|nr:hypothetical protein [endosymbiont GvMRE of Glomus versiforme]RHZ35206.1 hypothetical protein GvMRE_IIg215 [endosymbiont GvMRE of Glomus versiforme]